MSDPVTNVEDVEDVLSSIRRLVTDTSSDKRGVQATDAENQPEQSATEDRPREALVLTSALRIKAEPSDDAVEPEGTKPTDLESLRRAVSGEYDDDASHDEQPEAASTSSESLSANWVSTLPEDYYEDEPDEAVTAEPEIEEQSSLDEDVAEGEDLAGDVEELSVAEAEIENEPEQDSAQEAEMDEPIETAEIHQFESAAPEADEAEDEDLAEIEVFDGPEADAEEDSLEEGASKTSDEEHEAVSDEEIVLVNEPQDQESDGHDEVETVGIASFLRSSGVSRDADQDDLHLDHDASATMFAADGDDEDDVTVDLGDMDEAVIDEDMLRDLVAEIVRQELTGAMGERITRNVRKLVRREIHRAMVTREFD